MISISQRVLHAIELIEQGKYEFALEQASIAIDVSSQRFDLSASSARSYKKFVHEYYWIFELMALNGIDLKNSFFSNYTIYKQNGKFILKPQLSDILYHSVRCPLIHATGVPVNLIFAPERKITLSSEYISLPDQVIWGMLASVVFSKCNSLEKSEGDYFFTYAGNHFLIRESWGREDLLKPLYDQHVKVKVALNIPPLKKTIHRWTRDCLWA